MTRKISLRKSKKPLFENKFTKCVSKPKDLQKVLKSLGIQNKSGGYIAASPSENQIIKQATNPISKLFKISISTWQEVPRQNFPIRQIDTQLNLTLIIIKKLKLVSSTGESRLQKQQQMVKF